VTGHDGKGRAVVKIDEVSKNIVSNRPGASACVVWTTDTIPADNSGDSDASTRKVGTTLPGGTVFRVIEFSPGVAPRVHRTDSIDYAVVISGEIDMELEKRHRSPSQGWRRTGAARHRALLGESRQGPVRDGFVLVDAKPRTREGSAQRVRMRLGSYLMSSSLTPRPHGSLREPARRAVKTWSCSSR